MSELIKKISENEFDQEIGKGNVLVDFFADWCGPCRTQAPVLEEVAKEVSTIKFLKINIDESQETATRLHITSIPTLVLYQDGKEVGRVTGLLEREALEEFLAKAK